MSNTLQFITDFGDQAVILPAGAVAIAALLALRRWRLAAVFTAAIVVCFALLLALKLGFQACGSPLPQARLRSPSGHTMAATLVYGGMCLIAGVSRRASLGAALLIAVTIGGTRIALGAHSVPEVVVGGAVGLAGVAVMARCMGRRAGMGRIRIELLPVAVALLPIMILHGQRSRIEAGIHVFALRYVGAFLGCTDPGRSLEPGGGPRGQSGPASRLPP